MEDDMLILVNKPSLEHMAVMDDVNKPDLLSDDELMHFGIEGMKWGIRRFQNPDGTLTPEGKRRLQMKRDKAEKHLARTKKNYIKMGPKYVAKHIDLFTEDELKKIYNRYDWIEKLNNQSRNKRHHLQGIARDILGAGKDVNDLISFINSPAGRTIRDKMNIGDPNENLFYWSPQKKKKPENDKDND